MARAVYQHELSDPDFVWLLSKFQETHPGYTFVESSSLPSVFIKGEKAYEILAEAASAPVQKADLSPAEDDSNLFSKDPPK